MKKFAKWLGVFAVVVCLGVAMMGCNKLEGKYSHSEKDDETGITVKITIELKKDDVCAVSTKYTGLPDDLSDEEAAYMQNATIEGTYSIDGDRITIKYGVSGLYEVTMEGTIKKGKSITIDTMNGEKAPEGEEVVYKR